MESFSCTGGKMFLIMRFYIYICIDAFLQWNAIINVDLMVFLLDIRINDQFNFTFEGYAPLQATVTLKKPSQLIITISCFVCFGNVIYKNYGLVHKCYARFSYITSESSKTTNNCAQTQAQVNESKTYNVECE